MQGNMNDLIYFSTSVAAGLLAWFTIFATLIWPKLKTQSIIQRLKALTVIHFFRYFGTTFLIVGLVVHKLPAGFADPAAFGDLIAIVLAYIAFISLQRSNTGSVPGIPVWIFNIIGAVDLLFAFVMGPLLIKNIGDFGVTYLIPTLYVPLLLVAHFYSFKTLTSSQNR
jgi:hypothetical protein